MRRKLTEPDEPLANEGGVAWELPELTEQQAKFVEFVLLGETASDAYRKAYDCSGSSNRTIWIEASRLRNGPKVSAWLEAARLAGTGSGKLTLDGHMKELERLREIALRSGNVGAAVQAEQLRGKAMGHYTERLEVQQTDPMATLREINQLDPEIAAILARKHGVELPN